MLSLSTQSALMGTSVVNSFTRLSLLSWSSFSGLRFLRAMQFIRLADILQYMGIIHSRLVVKLKYHKVILLSHVN